MRKGTKHTEETKRKQTEATKRQWQNPEFRERMFEIHKGSKRTEETKAKMRASHIGMTGKTHTEETKVRMSITHSGENNYNWQGGISFEPYGVEFNDELKSQIRDRDNHTCQECHYTEEQLGRALDVHHIDYNKTNNSPENLISLCRSCHMQTNFSREDWIDYFRKMNGGTQKCK